jgi:hypothetical protein
MLVIRNFGQKSLEELKDSVVAKGLDRYLPESIFLTDGSASTGDDSEDEDEADEDEE